MTSRLELAIENLKGLDREAQEEIGRYRKKDGYRKRWGGAWRDRQLFWSGKVEKGSASHFSTTFLIYLVYTPISDSWVFMNNEHYRKLLQTRNKDFLPEKCGDDPSTWQVSQWHFLKAQGEASWLTPVAHSKVLTQTEWPLLVGV